METTALWLVMARMLRRRARSAAIDLQIVVIGLQRPPPARLEAGVPIHPPVGLALDMVGVARIVGLGLAPVPVDGLEIGDRAIGAKDERRGDFAAAGALVVAEAAIVAAEVLAGSDRTEIVVGQRSLDRRRAG